MTPSSLLQSVSRLSLGFAVAGVGAAAIAAGGLTAACGADNAISTAAEVASGSSDGGTPIAIVDSPDLPDTDVPYMSHADAGCPVKFVGPKKGTIALSIPRAGAATPIAWKTPLNALAVDGQFSRAELDIDQESEYLRITGYGFSLPSTVTIKGVVVQLKRQGANAISDGLIALWLDGVPADRPKVLKNPWPKALGTHHYGQEVDTWGNDLTPEILSKPGFGTQLYAKRSADTGTGAIAAEVESLQITVWYCE